MDKVYLGDCLEIMPELPDKSIDMILCDLPYGTTACKWDTIILLEPLWEQYKRVIKDNGVIVLTSSQPFTTDLINSNRTWFRYTWVWDKLIASGFNYARFQPMRQHEDIVVFYKTSCKYDSEGEPYDKPIKYKPAHSASDSAHMSHTMDKSTVLTATHQRKRSIIRLQKIRKGYHPTEKPVALFEYLIKTYTNEGDLVLDNCIGSGTTAVACINLNRHYIGCELEKKYYDIALKRIEEAKQRVKLL